MLKRSIIILLILCLPFISLSGQAMTRDEIRAAYATLATQREGSPYESALDPADPDTLAVLRAQSIEDALDYLNFLRALAGLKPVKENALYTLRSQYGAQLLALNDALTHTPEIYPGMSEEVYETAYAGTSLGNIASFNWMRPEILCQAIAYFARDDGEDNLALLGHRRWLLSPRMAETGFGLANAASGMSYAVMYAVDEGAPDIDWDYICWPADGAFPADLMRSDLAWSITLNDKKYDITHSDITIELREINSGMNFTLIPGDTGSDGYATLSAIACGAGPCIIFRPDPEALPEAGYQQNQCWRVTIRGLVDANGEACEIDWQTDMISLAVQDVANIEITPTQAQLNVGDTLQAEAAVIPAYADDLQIIWTSNDPSIASVDESGLVTALAAGSCEITAASANGRIDSCLVQIGAARK